MLLYVFMSYFSIKCLLYEDFLNGRCSLESYSFSMAIYHINRNLNRFADL